MKKETIEGLREAVKNGFTPHRTTIIALLDIAERSTSPVSQMTDEQIEKHISSVQAPESTVAIDEIVACFEGEECEEVFESIKAYGEIYARRALLALAAAAPQAQDNEGEKT